MTVPPDKHRHLGERDHRRAVAAVAGDVLGDPERRHGVVDRRSVLWFVFCASDGIDGYIARRHGTTTAGAFLDPLADKVLVLGAMFTLVSTGVFWMVPVDHHRRPRVRHQRLPRARRRQGHQRPGQPSSPSARRSASSWPSAFALLPWTARRRNVALERAAVDRRRAGADQRGAVPVDSPVSSRVADPVPLEPSVRRALSDAALRRARRRHRAAARADHRLELGVDGRRTRGERHRLARAGQGRRQRRPDRGAAAPPARVGRRRDHVRWARARPTTTSPATRSPR